MKTSRPTFAILLVTALTFASSFLVHAEKWVTYTPREDANGKYILLLSGDEEYRSEEGLPMLAKILSQRHGFKCTVLFSQDPETGFIDPNNQTHVPGMELLAQADLVFLQFRFRELPDPDMQHLVDYLQSGKPLIAIRTSTHAFAYERDKQSPFAHWGWRGSASWPGGFGRIVLGETWINHHGRHGNESTRGLIDGLHMNHPALTAVSDVWGPSDVYGIRHLQPTDQVLMHGLTLRGMEPDSEPNYDKPLMPLVWLRDFTWDTGNTTTSLTSTIGAATDLESAGLRRLFVNAAYWLTDLEVPKEANVEIIGEYDPTDFGFGSFKKNVKPSDHALP